MYEFYKEYKENIEKNYYLTRGNLLVLYNKSSMVLTHPLMLVREYP